MFFVAIVVTAAVALDAVGVVVGVGRPRAHEWINLSRAFVGLW